MLLYNMSKRLDNSNGCYGRTSLRETYFATVDLFSAKNNECHQISTHVIMSFETHPLTKSPKKILPHGVLSAIKTWTKAFHWCKWQSLCSIQYSYLIDSIYLTRIDIMLHTGFFFLVSITYTLCITCVHTAQIWGHLWNTSVVQLIWHLFFKISNVP